VPGKEPGSLDLKPDTLNTRPQRRFIAKNIRPNIYEQLIRCNKITPQEITNYIIHLKMARRGETCTEYVKEINLKINQI
jgi:hypothetical protein